MPCLCCAVPCLCRAVPAVPCRAVPCLAVPCRAVPCHAVRGFTGSMRSLGYISVCPFEAAHLQVQIFRVAACRVAQGVAGELGTDDPCVREAMKHRIARCCQPCLRCNDDAYHDTTWDLQWPVAALFAATGLSTICSGRPQHYTTVWDCQTLQCPSLPLGHCCACLCITCMHACAHRYLIVLTINCVHTATTENCFIYVQVLS